MRLPHSPHSNRPKLPTRILSPASLALSDVQGGVGGEAIFLPFEDIELCGRMDKKKWESRMEGAENWELVLEDTLRSCCWQMSTCWIRTLCIKMYCVRWIAADHRVFVCFVEWFLCALLLADKCWWLHHNSEVQHAWNVHTPLKENQPVNVISQMSWCNMELSEKCFCYTWYWGLLGFSGIY